MRDIELEADKKAQGRLKSPQKSSRTKITMLSDHIAKFRGVWSPVDRQEILKN